MRRFVIGLRHKHIPKYRNINEIHMHVIYKLHVMYYMEHLPLKPRGGGRTLGIASNGVGVIDGGGIRTTSTYGSPSTDDSDEARLTRTSMIGDIEVITIIWDTSYMR